LNKQHHASCNGSVHHSSPTHPFIASYCGLRAPGHSCFHCRHERKAHLDNIHIEWHRDFHVAIAIMGLLGKLESDQSKKQEDHGHFLMEQFRRVWRRITSLFRTCTANKSKVKLTTFSVMPKHHQIGSSSLTQKNTMSDHARRLWAWSNSLIPKESDESFYTLRWCNVLSFSCTASSCCFTLSL
jgi:hypothetical protein